MIFLYGVGNSLLLGGLIYMYWLRQKDVSQKKWFFPALICKLLCGILSGIFFQRYFQGGDTFLFQSQSLLLTEYFKASPAAYFKLWFTNKYESETVRTAMIYYYYSNSYTMVFLLSFLNLITGNLYYLNSLYFSLFSFFGAWQLVKTLGYIYPQNKYAAVVAFLFFPSVVFWSSGVMKEAVYLGALYWLFSAVLNLVFRNYRSRWLEMTGTVVAAYVLWKIRYYFAAVVFPLLFSLAVLTWAKSKYIFLKIRSYQVLLFSACLLVFSFLVYHMEHVLRLDYFFLQLTQSYEALVALSANRPHITYPALEPTVSSVLAHAPIAIIQTILRPLVWEGDNWFYKAAGLENVIILLLIFGWLFSLFRYPPPRFDLLLFIFLVYIIIIGTLIGLSTPNLGSLNRYRVAYLPFLIYLLLQTKGYRLLVNKYFAK